MVGANAVVIINAMNADETGVVAIVVGATLIAAAPIVAVLVARGLWVRWEARQLRTKRRLKP